MKLRFLGAIPLAIALFSQYTLLHQYEAGRRTWLAVVTVTLCCSLALFAWLYVKRSSLKFVQMSFVVVVIAICAFVAMLVAEKISRPAIQLFSKEMLITIPFMLLLAGGWIVGIGTVIGLWLHKKIQQADARD
jgi:Na+-translocating ferredoxin:NAD+ oxidoreductase RnfD subunit